MQGNGTPAGEACREFANRAYNRAVETLEIGSGQTNEDSAAALEKRRAELRDEARSSSRYFFFAAGCALLCSGLLPLRITFLIDLGGIALARNYAPATVEQVFHYALLVPSAATTLAALGSMVLLVVLGLAGRQLRRWAFLVGLGFYAADAVALTLMLSIWSVGVHGFLLFRWYQAQQALAELNNSPPAASS